jgi:hypothetical protein
VLPVMGLGVAGGSNLMGLVDFEFACGFCAVDRGGLRGGFLVDSGEDLRCGGSGWVMYGVALGGFVRWLSVVLEGFGRFRW